MAALADLDYEALAGLTYVSDADPGYRRIKARAGFRYVDTKGHPIRDQRQLSRIKKLAIPPAWTDVWISPRADGHLQATGRDAKHRKQYRYHAQWRAFRDRTKYDRSIEFGMALPRIRARVDADLRRHGMPREKVLATVVGLLDQALIRVGNVEYARSNNSFGLTTLRDRHARINGGTVRFEFRGKSGKVHSVTLRNRRLARIVRQCQEIPGQELFQYFDEEGNRQRIGSADVNEYIREASGSDFTAKDFRTWAGTVIATQTLAELEPFASETQAKHNLVEAVKCVAEQLGNTPAVCRASYIHPDVIDLYSDGRLADELKRSRGPRSGLSAGEASVLRILRRARDSAVRP
jgi:DNA topoisomerase-1